MAIFAIGDMHLSLGTDKPMDVFPGWEGYLPRLEASWRKLIGPDDTVVLAGDTSWAMNLNDTKAEQDQTNRTDKTEDEIGQIIHNGKRIACGKSRCRHRNNSSQAQNHHTVVTKAFLYLSGHRQFAGFFLLCLMKNVHSVFLQSIC